MKRYRVLSILVSVAVVSAIIGGAPASLNPPSIARAASGTLGVSPSSGAAGAQVTFSWTSYYYDCRSQEPGCDYDIRWDDPSSGPTICAIHINYVVSYYPSCSGPIPSDDLGTHTVYLVDHGCTTSCTPYDSGPFNTSQCNTSDTIVTSDANTYDLQAYSGFDPSTASSDLLDCYGFTIDMGSMTAATPVSETTGGGGSTDPSMYDSTPAADTTEEVAAAGASNPIYNNFFKIWAGYANRTSGNAISNKVVHDASTHERYTRAFATWTAPITADAKTLTWVGLGGFDTETGCGTAVNCAPPPQGVSGAHCANGGTSFSKYQLDLCLIQAGTASSDPGNLGTPVKFWYENYPYQIQQRFSDPAVHPGDSVYVRVRYGPGTQQATYTFVNKSTHRYRIVVKTIHDPSTNSAECVVEQGYDNPYDGYAPVTFNGCGVRWYAPANPSQNGIANIGSSGDPGPVTDIYGWVGYPHNTLNESTGSFTVSCTARSSHMATVGGHYCIQ